MAAVFPIRPEFVHRSNRNGTTDSSCRSCFITVANAMWEAELERKERVHACDPSMVEKFHKNGRPAMRSAVVSWHLPA
jgi:hypothetical protein